MAITSEQIVASLCVYFNTNLTLATATNIQWPGAVLDKEAIDDWVEIYVTRDRRLARRKGNLDRREVEITVRCYAKSTTSIYRMMDITKAVSDALEHAEVVLRNYNAVGNPRVGGLRIFEPDRSVQTREFNDPTRTDVRVAELTFMAYAQGDS